MDTKSGGRSGLINNGNTCFMNTAIQCLGHIDILRNYIIKHNFNENTQKCCFQLKRLLIGLWENNCTVNPVSFHKTIKEIAKKEKVNINFTRNIQNDLQEFVIFILEVIEKELGEKNTFIKDNFQGSIITFIKDIDNKTVLSKSSQIISILPLPCSETLEKCIEIYKNPEKLDGENQWFNEKTKQKQDVLKSYEIEKYPRELIISFNRFKNNGNKINNNIEFPDIYIVNKKYKYELKSIGNHVGNMFGGHYFAHVKHGDEWLIYNDSSVQNIDNYKTSNSYVLFYSLIEN
jgi:ubiquitin carboxyl-terminal hydrolase 2/21